MFPVATIPPLIMVPTTSSQYPFHYLLHLFHPKSSFYKSPYPNLRALTSNFILHHTNNHTPLSIYHTLPPYPYHYFLNAHSPISLTSFFVAPTHLFFIQSWHRWPMRAWPSKLFQKSSSKAFPLSNPDLKPIYSMSNVSGQTHNFHILDAHQTHHPTSHFRPILDTTIRHHHFSKC